MKSLFKRELWRKELVAWYLYDFAISMVFINLTLYFSQWVVVDHHVPDIWYSLPYILATLALVFVSTVVGRHGDVHGSHYRIFLTSTILSVVSVLLLFLLGRLLPGMGAVAAALVLFCLYQFFMQLAFVPYYAYIKHISTEATYGRVSGIGFAFGQLGNIAGIAITLPVIQGAVTVFGTDRLAPIVPVLILLVVFALPSFIALRKRTLPPLKEAVEKDPFWKTFIRNLGRSRKHPGVLALLVSFYLFSDAIQTITLYSAIYLQKVFGIADTAKSIIFLLVLVGFVFGAFFGGWLADRYGRRFMLIVSLFLNATSIIAIAVTARADLLQLLFFLFGLSMGSSYAACRSYFAFLIPAEESGTFFGLYTFAERFASVVGPALWGIVVFAFATLAPANYRIAAFAMGLLVMAGMIPLLYGVFKTRKSRATAWSRGVLRS